MKALAVVLAALILAATANARKPLPMPVLVPPPDTPAGVAKMADSTFRPLYRSELRKLDSFLAGHPQIKPMRDRLWYMGWHNKSEATPVQVAGIVWCVLYRSPSCT